MADSSTSNGFGSEDLLVKKSKIPDNTAFKQQKLPAWQPILTAKSILPGFFVIAVIFIPVGAVLLTASQDVIEAKFDYTNCSAGNGQNCAELRLHGNYTEKCECTLRITVDKEMTGDIYVYYALTSFYQNHRRYVVSRDDYQLMGIQITDPNNLNQDCASFKIANNKPIAPCGAVANSLFNDTYVFDSGIYIDRTGIAWHTDHTVKFRNPKDPTDTGNITKAFEAYSQPINWQKRVEELDETDPDNNGYLNEALEVWMRTAAFPNFRKPYGRLNTTSLKAGEYTVKVQYDFPVTTFGGTKTIILSTTSWMGGKNDFLGIAYIVVGSLSLAVCIALCIVHQVTHKKSTPSSPSSMS